ncbi:MAG: UDP-N-acetylmuramoyl-L-alanyl-D-glutamate--2,6-diaminopimelate ligase [Bacteroidetes bacterium]|nr:UDP-N-acetylmuramoyl-L-alanyl-D-glutamate--2,6-diaminopimelate ligase [Bacteroidota bacterium]
MKLKEIIQELEVVKITGSTAKEVSGISFDSRKVVPGDLFVAIRGTGSDGHDYIPQTIASGAVVVVSEEEPLEGHAEITWVKSENPREALALMASAFYAHPSRDLHMVGITGTNGKTTIATLLHQVHTSLGFRAGLLSTIRVVIGEEEFPATHTTPDPLQINAYLRMMVESGCGYCFMEVSSHAIDQDRISGLDFNGGVFTNLTRDHLDYHKDFKSYLDVKKRFFDHLPSSAWALVNGDDKNGQVMLQNCRAEKHVFALRSAGEFRGRIREMIMEGSSLEINGKEVWVKLPGRFNASNLLGTYGAAVLSGQVPDDVLTELSNADPVKGRFESFHSEKGVTGVVDYAHTPDALSNVLETIREVNIFGGEVITVVGAGGNRDQGKRPQIARIATEASHKVILTSDNPREEDPDSILDEMMEGVPSAAREKVLRIISREEAIRTACMLAGAGDIILIAGKGHENYQVIGNKKMPFDDMLVLKQNLN